MSQSPWWKGARGEWYVVIQIVLLALVVFGPRMTLGWPAWASPYTQLGSIAGGILLVMGGLLATAGIFKLGANLTAVPYPKEQATLVETGPYRLVRHPIYSGAIIAAFGWAFLLWKSPRFVLPKFQLNKNSALIYTTPLEAPMA